MDIGGAERALFQLIRAQLDRGYSSVGLLASGTTGHYAQESERMGAKVYTLGQLRAWDVRFQKPFLTIIDDFDLIHFHSASPLLMYWAGKTKGKILAFTHRAGFFRYPLKKRLSYAFSGWVLRRFFDGVSGNTRFAAMVAETMFGLNRNSVMTTYNGVDFGLLRAHRSHDEVLSNLGFPNKQKTIFVATAANLRAWKRIDLLIHAMDALRDLPVHCFVIGDGPDRSRLQKISRDLGLETRISFLGKKKHVGDFLQVMDVFVLPSGNEESFGNAVVEAMGLGVPSIIMKDGGGMLEHITKGGGIIAQYHADLAEQIRILACDESLRAQVGTTGQAYVRGKYSYEACLNTYAAFYEKCLAHMRNGSR